MPGRTWVGAAGGYRYSHNGHEKEDEIFNGAQSAEYWMYDSRIIRRWETDPLAYEWQSPYACFNNNPILYADPYGLEGEPKTGETRTNSDGTTSTFNGKDWQNTPVGQSTSPAHAVQLPEIEIGSDGSSTVTRTENAANANIDNSTRAGENPYSFNNPNYIPTPQQQNWYNFADFAQKTTAVALTAPFVMEAFPAQSYWLLTTAGEVALEEAAGMPNPKNGVAKSAIKDANSTLLNKLEHAFSNGRLTYLGDKAAAKRERQLKLLQKLNHF